MLQLLNHLWVFLLKNTSCSLSPQSISTALSVQAQWWHLLQWLERSLYWYQRLRLVLTLLSHGLTLLTQTGVSFQKQERPPYASDSGSAPRPAVRSIPSANEMTLHHPDPFWDFSCVFGVFKSHALGSPDDLKVYNDHVCLDISDSDVCSVV